MSILTQTNFTRRSFGLMASAAFLWAGNVGGAIALTAGQARSLIDAMVVDIFKIIDSGKSSKSMYGDFEKFFNKYGDVPIIARQVLGVDSRRATSRQMSAFTKAFSGYLSRKYGKRFREFIGGRIQVDSSRAVKSFFEVKTTAFLKGQAPFNVTFLVSDKSGRDKFFNMYIEGINVTLTEKAEIGAMLDRRGGNIDKMIADLKRAG